MNISSITDKKISQRTHSRPTLNLFQRFVSLSPILMYAGVYLLAVRAASLLGHWPLPGTDDPKMIGGGDLIYSALALINILPGWVGLASIIIWPGLTVLIWRFSSKTAKIWTVAVFILGWVLLWADPASILNWWFD